MTTPLHGMERPVFPGPELEKLMVRYQNADRESTTALITALSPPLLRFFATTMGNRAEAEDMLQDAWMKIHRARYTYRAGEPLLPWVFAIARHVRVDRYRKWRRVAAHETAVVYLPEEPAPIGPSTVPLSDFESMVAPLPLAQREVVTLLKREGLSLEEVAGATRSTVGAVKQKAHRAYTRLRKLWEPDFSGRRKKYCSSL